MWLAGGSVAVSGTHGAVSPDYRVFELSPLVEGRYLHHLLRSPAYFEQYRLYMRADTTFDRRVQQEDLDQLPLALPPIEQQRQTADFLDDQVARIDAAIQLRRTQASSLASRSRVLLVESAKAMGANELDVPWLPRKPSWSVVPLKAVAQCLDYRRVPLSSVDRAQRAGPYPYYGASTVVDYIDDYLFDGQYVLVGEDGAALENTDFDVVQIAHGRFWVNNHAHVLAPRETTAVGYLAAYLRCADRARLISGATRAKITQEDLMNLPIVLPSRKEQEELVQAVTAGLRSGTEASSAIDRGASLLEERKRALIAAAMTGAFDVTTAGSRAVAAATG